MFFIDGRMAGVVAALAVAAAGAFFGGAWPLASRGSPPQIAAQPSTLARVADAAHGRRVTLPPCPQPAA